jgi:sarcosine oxidase subunit alpha
MIGASRQEGMMQRLLVGRMFQGRLVPDSMRTESGGRVERRTDIRFRFDGTDYLGCGGDTLASALLANGIHLVGRSVKYHRPRGILASGAEEPNALVTVLREGGRTTPNLRATQVELFEGLEARSQNRWPSLDTDVGALSAWASPLMPAGFFYKTMMGPRGWGLWHRAFESLVRRAAGLGRAPTQPDPDRYARFHDHCDVLVVGAGPAGIAAALAAGRRGLRVVLCDEQAEPGGALLTEIAAFVDFIPARDWLARSLDELAGMGVRVMARTTAFGLYPHSMVGLAERVTDHLAAPDAELPRERLCQMRAGRVVLAAGAIERPLLFANNDRPGVMLAGAARDYLLRYGVKVGQRVVVATACDSAYRTALDLKAAGVEVKVVLDLRPEARGPLPDAVRDAGIPVLPGGRVLGTHMRRLRLDSVKLGRGDDGRTRWFDCDALLVSNGWTPTVHLAGQARAALRWDADWGGFVGGRADGIDCIGACAGAASLAEALAQGAALFGAEAPPVDGELVAPPAPGVMVPGPGKPVFVDFQNDVTARDIGQAVGEGFRSVEHVKRYTAGGLGTDQGKTGNPALFALTAAARGEPVDTVGTTGFRPPYTPVTFGTLAGPARGALFDPVRTTAMHDRAVDEGAVFEDVGEWKRARYFPRAGEDLHAAVAREAAATRASCGMFDASTLGKIEVAGPDAAVFLDRIYVNRLATLPVGRCRYAVMLSEAGFVMDDGVVARLAEDRFHVTTTTGGAARVQHHMEDYLQTEWPDLRVWLTSTTEHWAVIAVQGPKAREVLAPLADGDISAAALPHMAVRTMAVAGAPARLMRVSFTGEPGFEVNVPARHAPALWDALRARVAAVGGTVYGTEAMHVLRAEKGFVIVGQETDGTVTPGDLGLPQGMAKADFVGKRSLLRPDMLAADRRQLVGLLTDDPAIVPEEGAQLVGEASQAPGAPALGHVTSAYRSPALGRSIALALLAGGRARIGERVFVAGARGAMAVTVTAPVFLDPQGERLHD